MPFDFEKFQQTKNYDLLMGLPLIVWFGYVQGVRVRPSLVHAAQALLLQPDSLFLNLRFLAIFSAIAFNLLSVYLIVVRRSPVLRSRGVLPNLCGFVGTFLGVGIQYLTPVTLPLGWQILSTALLVTGGAGSVIVLANLGRSFSIMPEARVLVTGGPYAYARHPLYAVEIVTILGAVMLYRQPWAGLLGVAVIAMLVVRSHFEEKVLAEAFPEYLAYKAKIKRFGFI